MTNKTSCDDLRRRLEAHVSSIHPSEIAQALKLDASAVSRMKTSERGIRLEELPKLLALPSKHFPQGLTLVTADGIVVSRAELAGLKSLARQYLNLEAANEHSA